MVKTQKKTNRKTMEEHSEDALYREVWEEMHAQKLYDFIRRNIRYIIAAAALVVISVAGIVTTQRIRRGNAMEMAANYESALDMNPELSREALSRLAKTSSGGMGDLALFSAYQLALASGDRADALAKLEKLAEGGATRDFRDLALVQLAQLKSDDISADDFQKMLAPLLTKRSPFYYTGLLFVAEKYMAENKVAEARQYIRKITSEPTAPASIAATAEMMMK
jgi:hypothetical protein